MNTISEPFDSLPDEIVEMLSSSVVQENGLTGIPSQDDVVKGTGKVYSRFSGHMQLSRQMFKCQT